MSRTRRSRSSPRPEPGAAGLAWTPRAIRALGARTDLATAAHIFGMSLTTAYRLVKRDAFPVPVIRVGGHYVVPVAPILAALHVPPDAESDADTG